MSFTDAPEFDTNDGQRDGAIPRFYMDSQPDAARSAADGVPRFRDVEMVEVRIPGDRLNTPVFLVTDTHRQRWPKFYAAFKAQQEAPVDGTPIEQLPGITKGQVEELKHFHVLTIESLAALPDEMLKKAQPIGGFATREKAQRWVNAAQGGAAEERLAAENRELKDKMATMEQDQASLRDALAKMQAQIDARGASPVDPTVLPPGS